MSTDALFPTKIVHKIWICPGRILPVLHTFLNPAWGTRWTCPPTSPPPTHPPRTPEASYRPMRMILMSFRIPPVPRSHCGHGGHGPHGGGLCALLHPAAQPAPLLLPAYQGGRQLLVAAVSDQLRLQVPLVPNWFLIHCF